MKGHPLNLCVKYQMNVHVFNFMQAQQKRENNVIELGDHHHPSEFDVTRGMRICFSGRLPT